MRRAVVAAALSLVVLAGCSDWDNAATQVAREMQRIRYGCGDFQTADTDDLDDRGITAAGTCSVNGQTVTINVYKSDAARDVDEQRREDRCRRAAQPDRAFQALPYVRTSDTVIEGVFIGSYSTPPEIISRLWAPTVAGIASATKGTVQRPNC